MAKADLTAQRLREVLHYNPETGVFTWLANAPSRNMVGKTAGSFDRHGYRQLRLSGMCYRAHRLAWLYVYGEIPTTKIDHINGVRYDNRIVNLRQATDSENMRNQGKHSDGTSGFKGVTLHKKSGKWQAACWASGKQRYLGLFATGELASSAYQKFAKENHGEFFRP